MRMFADTFLIIIHLYCMIACSGISESDSSFCGTPVSKLDKVMFLGTVFCSPSTARHSFKFSWLIDAESKCVEFIAGIVLEYTCMPERLNGSARVPVPNTYGVCREAPGLDKYRPDQQTPVVNFYMAGSYTAQDYIDSMEGATLSGRQAAYKIIENASRISARKPETLAQLT